MTQLKKFTKENIEEAIRIIDLNPSLRMQRESTNYDLVYDGGKRYPPILVLSEANKLLGGSKLTLNDFDNSTTKAFKILRELGFEVTPKKPINKMNDSLLKDGYFDYKDFLDACKASNLYINEHLGLRFIASLMTKPFIILTGLSGSGKTKLALAFAKWITNKTYTSFNKGLFYVGEEVKSSRVAYVVSACDDLAVTFTQPETGTKATFPYELIFEWITTIKNNNFTTDTLPRTIREEVAKITEYSTQLNSFETHLKAAAFHLMEKGELASETKSAICLVPVGADWTNRDPLLGYPSALDSEKYVLPENGALQLIIDAQNNPDKPHFLILDEMNLSHVERYFADFLSAMESKESIALHSAEVNLNGVPPSVELPTNLFIIGTVNVDETTYMFSPKVLDRANVIEFRIDETEMLGFLSNNVNVDLDVLAGMGVNAAEAFLKIARNRDLAKQANQDILDDLILFFRELKKTGAEFGFRSASEIIRFSAIIKAIEPNWDAEQILDAAIMQKLLPKVHGSRRKLEDVLKSLAELCLKDKSLIVDFLNPKKEFSFNRPDKIKYPVSLEKIRRMFLGLIHNAFTSYAEA